MKKFILLIIPIVFWGCSEDPTSIGDQFLDKNIDYFADTLLQSATSTYTYETNTNTSDVLFIGKYDNISEASLLLKFNMPTADSIAARVTKIQVKKVELFIYPLYFLGSKNFNFTAQPINKFWDYTKNNSEIISSVAPLLGNNVLISSSVTDTLVTLTIDTTVAETWLKAVMYDTSAKNYGLKISSTADNAMVAFRGYSFYSTGKVTTLKVTYFDMDKNKEFSFTVTPTIDLSTFNGTIPEFDKNKYSLAQGGYTIATKVLFNLPANINKSVVNKAKISFEIDTILSTKNFSDTIYISLLSDETGEEVYGGSYSIYRVGSKKGYYEGSIVPLLQAIANDYVGNYGFRLFYGRDLNSVDKVYFKKESFKLILGYTQIK
ncbi:MAG TPA: hypothetical protein PLI27_08730 [Ignavibacteriales bacterium]|nr:hypothetical protein [Ignavibacteriales bacterium]HOL81065.1 hypothetical protein [Ignavibacteriales bacterium]HOM64800.1 hypothetical protein [Ignavibacteriales bacterium]HPD68144.1 hypothetical protein [Ignavibacteriales bacterium]HPP32846.1 hypothetical protein [Ignavibacteriales bacterium]